MWGSLELLGTITLTNSMVTPSNGNIFYVTGPLCGEFTGHRGSKKVRVKNIYHERQGVGFPGAIRHHNTNQLHGDAIKWKHFLRYWPFVRGIHRSPVNPPPDTHTKASDAEL